MTALTTEAGDSSNASSRKSTGSSVSSRGENTQTGDLAGDSTASRPASTERPSALGRIGVDASVTVAAPGRRVGGEVDVGVFVVPSPATLTHSRPEPFWPSAVQEAATGSGTATCASLLETAVLTTVPFT